MLTQGPTYIDSVFMEYLIQQNVCTHISFCPICTSSCGGQQTLSERYNNSPFDVDTDTNTIPLMFSCEKCYATRFKSIELRNYKMCIKTKTYLVLFDLKSVV